ncbi:dienelactone hydrolase family protein [Rummeliibacillus sp. NPDC094406]|uniref:dienelactone hydrolase family protein n=1 Tax=Rummeliibacillus sp. NPDC094406 TaxID=3364511 RepID=UPI0038139976
MNIFVIKQNQKKVVVLLHEIYGINDHMKYYANYFADFGYDVVCPNLIKLESPFSYEDEQQAYRHFTETIAFISAALESKQLIEELSSEYEEIHIIGFSVGATIAWLCSELKEVDRIVCFYGSRIRNYLEITPACSVLCIYGESEKSFDVTLLVNHLQMKRIESHILTGAHGFADPYSKEFKKDTYNKAKEIVKSFLLKKIGY